MTLRLRYRTRSAATARQREEHYGIKRLLPSPNKKGSLEPFSFSITSSTCSARRRFHSHHAKVCDQVAVVQIRVCDVLHQRWQLTIVSCISRVALIERL